MRDREASPKPTDASKASPMNAVEVEAALDAEYGPLRHNCATDGHAWMFYGGCACPRGFNHSHGVYVCSACGDCDYGDNDENREECELYAETALCYI